jgi:hypothetical protein
MVQTRDGAAVAAADGSKALSILLAAIGVIALVTSMWMNARFGWGLSPNLTDRTTLAVLHALVDPAAAGIIAAGGLMFRWDWRWQGTGLLAFAALLIAYSMLSVFGFMSTRIAATQSHDAIVEMQRGQWDWTLKSSIKREIPKQERRLLRAEAQDLAAKLEASLSIIPDAQATSIASVLDVPVAKVQRALVMISSGIAQTIKFICLLAAVMMWPCGKYAAKPTASSNDDMSGASSVATSASMQAASPASFPASPASMQAASPSTSHAPPASRAPFATMQTASLASAVMQRRAPTASPRMPLDKLYEYLREHASGMLPRLSQRQMALETGWHQSSISRKMRQLVTCMARRAPAQPGERIDLITRKTRRHTGALAAQRHDCGSRAAATPLALT